MKLADYIEGGTRALEAADFETAGRLLEAARDLDPNDIWPHYWLGIKLIRQGRFEDAAQYYRELLTPFPGVLMCYLGLAQSLISAKQFDAADEAILEGVGHCGHEYWLGFNYAQSAASRLDNVLAAERWGDLSCRYPDDGAALGRWARAQITLHNFDLATEILARASDTLKENTQVKFAEALLKSVKGEHKDAIILWRELRAQNPTDVEIETAWGHSEQAISFANDDSEAPDSAIPEDDEGAVLSRFASLGGDCEFGLVQRRFNQEPLGLLRWAAVLPDALARLFEDGMEILSDISKIELFLDQTQNVYFLSLPSYGLKISTMVKADTVEEAKFLVELSRRTKFLHRQLVGQLTNNEKYFVFKQNGPLDRTGAQKLKDAIGRFGPVRLLVVSEAPAAEDVGKLEIVDDYFAYGYLRGLGPYRGGWNIPYGEWLALCNKAVGHFDRTV